MRGVPGLARGLLSQNLFSFNPRICLQGRPIGRLNYSRHRYSPTQGPYHLRDPDGRLTFLPETPFQVEPLKVRVEQFDRRPNLKRFSGAYRDASPYFCTGAAVSSKKLPIVFANTARDVSVYRIRSNAPAFDRVRSGIVAKLDVTFSGSALNVLSIGGEEYLFMATNSDKCVFWSVADIYSSIPSPDTPFYASGKACSNTVIKQVPRMLTMPVSEPHEITCVTSHPNLPYIVVGYRTGKIELYELSGTEFVCASEADTLSGKITSIEILPLINSGHPDCEKSFLVNLAGVARDKRSSYKEYNPGPADPPITGFLGQWLIRIAESGIETNVILRRTYEAAWLTKTLLRSSLLQVPTKDELLGPIGSSIIEGKTKSGCIYEPTIDSSLGFPMEPNSFWLDEPPSWVNESKIQGTYSAGLRFTEDELIVLKQHVTMVSFSSQIFLCDTSTFNWLSCAPACSIGLREYMSSIGECYGSYGNCGCLEYKEMELALSRDKDDYVFDKWTYLEDLSLFAVLSRHNFVSFVRVGCLPDGTVGMRTEANIMMLDEFEGEPELPSFSPDLDLDMSEYVDVTDLIQTSIFKHEVLRDTHAIKLPGITSTALATASAVTAQQAQERIESVQEGYVITLASWGSVLHISVKREASDENINLASPTQLRIAGPTEPPAVEDEDTG